jgi:sarcosine oxidase subunit gamma
VADIALIQRSGLEEILTPGRHGLAAGPAGVTIARVDRLALATLMMRKGQSARLRDSALRAFAVELPVQPQRNSTGAISFIWAGPGRWLAASSNEAPVSFEGRLRAAFADIASVTNQSDGRSIIRVSGLRAREILAKGVPIDLDPRVFRTGQAALTIVGHINVQFWQVDDLPTYDFAIFRSFAASFSEWLLAAAAEFGADVLPPIAS